jgi:hypothetical protein
MKQKITYEEELKPIYIKSMEANQIYYQELKDKEKDRTIRFKIGKDYQEFKTIRTREAVLNDSLFLRYMQSSITRKSGDKCEDFIIVKFKYDVDCKIGQDEMKIDKHELRTRYYKDGVLYTYEKRNSKGKVVDNHTIHYKMLMRSTGKAKNGECIFIRDDLHHKATNFLTMGLYDLMNDEAKKDPEKPFNIVALSAYQTLTTATAIGYLHIPLDNILILKDEEVYSAPMKAAIVRSGDVEYEKDEFVIDFENLKLEDILNKKGFTVCPEKQDEGKKLIIKTKEDLKNNGIRVNGSYPGKWETITYKQRGCVVETKNDVEIKNILWDGMGLIDESVFPEGMDGFVYCRSHFFKSCLFRGNIQDFFADFCNENGKDYENYMLENVDMFERKLKLSDIKVVITDKSIKWLKFVDEMGGTNKKAFDYYDKFMSQNGNVFSIVKTAHPSKWGDLQLMAYQMCNSLPTTDRNVLRNITKCGVDFLNNLKESDDVYLDYLEKTKNNFNMNELLIELVRWNPKFLRTEFFRDYKSKDISKLKAKFKCGKLPQVADNLTIMDNPIAMLMKAVGENPVEEGCFKVVEDGVQCYTPRFNEGDRLAAFRSPHNSPNNILHLYNVYPEKLIRYFPNIGQNVIVFNGINTDTQSRASGHDMDSDFVYVTNQKEIAELAKTAYVEYPTIINDIKEVGESCYHFINEDFASMDNRISDAQEAIGTSTDTAQLALSYYYHDGMIDEKLKECFIVLSVIAQISIDLAKKNFDIDVLNEIRRIRNLPCMKRSEIPQFFADNKKQRGNKKFNDKTHTIMPMKCPMDIMAQIIDDSVIKRAKSESTLSINKLLNNKIKVSRRKCKENKVILETEEYKNIIKWIECHKENMDDSTVFVLKNRAIDNWFKKTGGNFTQEFVKQLVVVALLSDSDLCSIILKLLYGNEREHRHRDKFLNCFVRGTDKNASER